MPFPIAPAALLSLFLLGVIVVPAQGSETLTFNRLYAGQGLDGPQAGAVKFSPDGKKIAYLKGSKEEPRRFDLWLYDIAGKTHKRIVAASALPEADALDADERARRERQRIAATGIVSFDWAPAGDVILFSWNGQVTFYRLATGTLHPVTAATGAATGDMVNPALSPQSDKLGYVSGNDLYVLDIAAGKQKRLTKSKDAGIRYGVAEFVAAEEIGRETGFWWSPDDRHLAVIETDARPVAMQTRYEILGDGWRINHEPYPQAGTANVRVRLAIIDSRDGDKDWLDLGADSDIYIARVKWLADGSGLLVTRQSRDQKTVDLLLYDRKGKNLGVIIHETANTWVNLDKDLTELVDSPGLLWGSDRDGPHRIYRYDKTGQLQGPLTPMNLFVDRVVHVDETKNKLYVEGYEADPLERHLFSVDLDPGTDDAPQRMTLDAGLHHAVFSADGTRFIDRYSSPRVPYLLTVRATGNDQNAVLLDGRIGPDHPYSPWFPAHVLPLFGSIQAADGSALYYKLLMPRGLQPGARVPVIVNVYGGPGFQLVRKDWGPLWQQVALAKGYAVFMLDNRGSARRGKAFEDAIYRHLGDVEVQDQMAGIAWLKTQPGIDPQQIAVFGWSYGGYMVLKIGEAAGDGIAAVVSGAPVTDWRLYDSHYTERYMGMPQDDAAAYDKSSVFPKIGGLTAPLLLIHGLADDNVLFSNSTKLMAALQERVMPFSVMVYPGATHALRAPALREHLYKTIFQFLDRRMKP